MISHLHHFIYKLDIIFWSAFKAPMSKDLRGRAGNDGSRAGAAYLKGHITVNGVWSVHVCARSVSECVPVCVCVCPMARSPLWCANMVVNQEDKRLRPS